MVDVFVEDGYNFVTFDMKKSSEHVEYGSAEFLELNSVFMEPRNMIKV